MVRQTIGTAGDDLIQKVRQGMEGYLEWLAESDVDEEYEQSVRETTDVIIAKLKGQPAADLEDEGDAGDVAASVLLEHVDGDSRPRTRFEVKDALWFHLLHDHAGAMGKDAELFDYLAEGRPLFGRTNGGQYAWFDRDEAIRLREAAKRIAAAPHIRPDDVKTLTDEDEGLTGCIDRILAAGYDVWAKTG